MLVFVTLILLVKELYQYTNTLALIPELFWYLPVMHGSRINRMSVPDVFLLRFCQ